MYRLSVGRGCVYCIRGCPCVLCVCVCARWPVQGTAARINIMDEEQSPRFQFQSKISNHKLFFSISIGQSDMFMKCDVVIGLQQQLIIEYSA